MAGLNRYRRSIARPSPPDLTEISNKDPLEKNIHPNSAPDSGTNPNPPPAPAPRPPPSVVRGHTHPNNGPDFN
ncbi:hypothetical protein TWF506_001552 [Arthrobotrys conoides]|uniref:Uncharacterized protein n=1 Tax=Arthrobotrys conoides TaxID=74498 RepID=A0AAN8S1V9_9PEZI